MAGTEIDPVPTAEGTISWAEFLDSTADSIENRIPQVAPDRKDYWTQQVARLRRKADADREVARDLPHG